MRVISCQEQINRLLVVNTSRKHTRISIFKIFKVKSGMPEHETGKKTCEQLFFFHETMF